MGMSSSSGKKRKSAISEINVTPLVDVMLVLLVIFMVTAPLMLNGINLKLPKTKEVNPVNLKAEQIILSITKSEELYIGKNKILKNELIPLIKKLFKENKTQVVFLRADEKIEYGKVAALISSLKKNGIQEISLVTTIEK